MANLDLARAYCDLLLREWEEKRTRFRQFRKVHVSDALCPLKALFERFYPSAPPCDSLFSMRSGELWEEEAKRTLLSAGFSPDGFKVVLVAERGEVEYVATPDYVGMKEGRPEFFIEIKWTGFRPSAIREILFKQDVIASKVPSWKGNFEIPDSPRKSALWPSWILQVAGYLSHPKLSHLGPENAYLYVNRGGRVSYIQVAKAVSPEDIIWFSKRHEERIEPLFRILPTYSEGITILRDPREEHVRELWRLITSTAQHYRLTSFQCGYCPYMLEGTCPGLIPIKGFQYWSPEEVQILAMHAKVSEDFRDVLDAFGALDAVVRGDYEEALRILRTNPPSAVSAFIEALLWEGDGIFSGFKRYMFRP